MPIASIIVHASWDDDTAVWVATSKDVDGLAVEAPTMEVLEPKVLAALDDLINLNGFDADVAEVTVRIIVEGALRIGRPDPLAKLVARLEHQPVINIGRWTRDEMYEDES